MDRMVKIVGGKSGVYRGSDKDGNVLVRYPKDQHKSYTSQPPMPLLDRVPRSMCEIQ